MESIQTIPVTRRQVTPFVSVSVSQASTDKITLHIKILRGLSAKFLPESIKMLTNIFKTQK